MPRPRRIRLRRKWSKLRFVFDSTTIWLRHDYDEKMTLLASKSNGSRRARYVVAVWQSNRNFDHFKYCRSRMGRKYDFRQKTSRPTKGTMDTEGARLLTYSSICLRKPRLTPVHIHIHYYAPPRIVVQLAAALHAVRRQCTKEVSMSSFKSITWK